MMQGWTQNVFTPKILTYHGKKTGSGQNYSVCCVSRVGENTERRLLRSFVMKRSDSWLRRGGNRVGKGEGEWGTRCLDQQAPLNNEKKGGPRKKRRIVLRIPTRSHR